MSEGFQTERGELIRGITYPKPIDSEFNRHAMRFLLFLAVLSLLALGYSLYMLVSLFLTPLLISKLFQFILHSIPLWQISQKAGLRQIIIHTLSLFTIIIPPMLSAAMTIGIFFAQRRLLAKRIFCTSPQAITRDVSVNLFAVDKVCFSSQSSDYISNLRN